MSTNVTRLREYARAARVVAAAIDRDGIAQPSIVAALIDAAAIDRQGDIFAGTGYAGESRLREYALAARQAAGTSDPTVVAALIVAAAMDRQTTLLSGTVFPDYLAPDESWLR